MSAVRRLGPGDGALLRGIRLAALLDAPYAFASTHARERDDPPQRWEERVAQLAWFAVGRAALAAGAPSPDGIADRRHLVSMWVHPALRGRGVAGDLVAAVSDWAVADGAGQVALWVADGNDRAARLYARCGFTPTRRRQPLPSDPAVGEEMWVLALPGDRMAR